METTALPRGGGRIKLLQSIANSESTAPTGVGLPTSTTTQGYLNIKSYKEFENQNRPDGWNVWLTFVLSPAEQTPTTSPRRMTTR